MTCPDPWCDIPVCAECAWFWNMTRVHVGHDGACVFGHRDVPAYMESAVLARQGENP